MNKRKREKGLKSQKKTMYLPPLIEVVMVSVERGFSLSVSADLDNFGFDSDGENRPGVGLSDFGYANE